MKEGLNLSLTLYKDKYIYKVRDRYRVKNNRRDTYACHHGGFQTKEEAKMFIDSLEN